MFALASTVGNQSKIKALKTSSGLKDTYLETFLGRIAGSYSKKRTKQSKQTALDEFMRTLPGNVLSPVWRIKGEHIVLNAPISCADISSQG